MHKTKPANNEMEAAATAFATVSYRAAMTAMRTGILTPEDLESRAKGLQVEARLQNILIGVAPASHRPTKLKSKL